MAFRLVRSLSIRALMAALTIVFCHTSQADAVDELSIIVPLAPGGALDRFARTAERFLPNVIDADVTVENFSARKGEDGYQEFLSRPADGSTILAWFEPAVAAYEPGVSIDDLAIINVQEIEPPILAARRDLGWQNLDEMIGAIQQNPSSFTFGIGGRTGGGPLLTSALLENLDLKIRLATFSSGGKARKAVVKGEADFTAGSLSAIRKLGDNVVPLAVFSPRRLRAWPEVPTIREALGDQSQYAVHGAVYRFYAVHKDFAEQEPEKFAKLAEAFRRMTEDDNDFKNNSIERGTGALWLGPEDSTSLIRRSNQYFRTLIDNNSK